MEIRQFEILRAIAETRSFTRAAERVGLTQSAVSQQMKALEDELGEPLLVRTNRRIDISRAGEFVVEHAERVLSELAAVRAAFKGGEVLAASRLRVVVATQALVHLFTPTFVSFIRRYPQVELSFRTTANTNSTIEQIRSNVADVGFASMPIKWRELKVERLFDDELLLVVSRDHHLAGRPVIQPAELMYERFILYEQNVSVRQMTDAFFEREGIEPVIAVESNDTDFILQMVTNGVGISFMPAWAASEDLRKGVLVELPVVGGRLHRSVAVCYLKSNPSAAILAFLTFLRQHQQEIQRLARPETI